MVILFSETESEFQKQSPFLILDFTRKFRERGIQYVVRETKITRLCSQQQAYWRLLTKSKYQEFAHFEETQIFSTIGVCLPRTEVQDSLQLDFAYPKSKVQPFLPLEFTTTEKQTPTYTIGVCLPRTKVQDFLQLDFAYLKSKVQPFLPLKFTTTEKQTPTFSTIGVCLLRT